jgi:hypothetical protein
MTVTDLPPVSTAFAHAKLGDPRRLRRLLPMVDQLAENPTASFPKALKSTAAVEAFYRFVSNGQVSWRQLVDPMAEASLRRAAPRAPTLAIHDSTLFQFHGEVLRDGTFRTSADTCGYLGHVCLGVTADGTLRPHGVLGMIPVVRPSAGASPDSPGVVYEIESQRWIDLVIQVSELNHDRVQLIHIMDSEGDSFDLMSAIVLPGDDFVIRLHQDRRVLDGDVTNKLSALVKEAALRLVRTVRVSRRKKQEKGVATKRNAAREEREAVLEIRTTTVTLLRPQSAASRDPYLTVHIVHIVEVDVPAGEEPVEWLLATTLPIEDAKDVEFIVDSYRARWVIEEWFKALKTGCAYEERQLESLDSLLMAFAMLAPIATRLLELRSLGRTKPELPADTVLTSTEIFLLRKAHKVIGRLIPKNPTIGEAMYAVARLGGFLPSNKIAGWQVLGRGFAELQQMVLVYNMLQDEVPEM